ncbi:MAG: PEP-CTERM sorting domain-containing protein [Phycisphaerae bacterium]|nr:PEP-CTERM sorting domain-containing protein [Phycisphaerae bacterium]
MKNLLATVCVCVVTAMAAQTALADLTWYDAGLSQPTLQADLGGLPTVYTFEDQTPNGGDSGTYLGKVSGTLPTYGFTWTTNPSGSPKGWAPDDLTGYVRNGTDSGNPADFGNNWGTGPTVGASGKLLINTNSDWSSMEPIGVSFGTGVKGVGSLYAAMHSFTVHVYDTTGTLLGSHDFTAVSPTDAEILAAGFEVADYRDHGNDVLYWGVTSGTANIGGFTFDNAKWIIMDNMMVVPAPEPASLALLAAGLGGLLAARRRARK